jgi:plasmid rolling circle replication initiator protein Rep
MDFNTKNKNLQPIGNENLKECLNKPTEKKLLMSDFIGFMEDKNLKLDRLKECGNFIKFQSSEDKTKFILAGGNFCNNRFCPFCSWLKAKRTAFELLELIKVVEYTEKLAFIFITLTVPNVPKESLREEIENFNISFNRLWKTKEFKAFNKGFIRKLEITYNEERNDYHPHFHLVVAVNKSYFKSRNYMSKRRLLELWQRATRNPAITQVDIKPCRMNTIKQVMELATYSAKQGDLYSSKEVFDGFYEGLYRKKLLVYNGIFKEYKKKIDTGEVDPAQVIELNQLLEEATKEFYLQWEKDNYLIADERDVPEEQRKKFYNLEIDMD